jgi:hypothetical protein
MSRPLDFAQTYISRSWATVPVPFKGKKPDPAPRRRASSPRPPTLGGRQ